MSALTAGGGTTTAQDPPDSKSTTVYHASALGWWPQGDSGRLRAAADAWNRLAGEIDDIVADGTATVRRVAADNHGDGIDAFAAFWQRYTDGPKSLAAQADAARQIASACNEYADRIDTAKHEIEALRTAEVAIAVAGLALTIFTLGASDAAAGAAAAATVVAIEGIEAAVVDAIVAFVGRVLASAVFSAGMAAASDVIVQAIHHQYDPTTPISLSEVLDNAEGGFVAGAAFVGAFEGASAFATRGASLFTPRFGIGPDRTAYDGDVRLGPTTLPTRGRVGGLIPPGYNRFGGLGKDEFLVENWNPSASEGGSWKYPPNRGFDGAPQPETLPPGTVIDRFGSARGSYLSPDGVPFPQRGLPPDSLNPIKGYHRYEVVKPLPVQQGKIAPVFGQPGGGTQIVLDPKLLDVDEYVNVQWLLDHGYLRELRPWSSRVLPGH